ncbi:MAG: ATP-dependent helicase, partial [Brachybacterium sp.]|nr:ATP-dependent helicase [Brachybacterium sp.]
MRRIAEGAEVEAAWADVAHEGEEALTALRGRTPAGEPAQDPAAVKYKGAPRKLDIGRTRGADARKADARRMNEELRSVYEENPEAGAGSGRARGAGRSGQQSRRGGAGGRSGAGGRGGTGGRGNRGKGGAGRRGGAAGKRGRGGRSR